MITVNCINKTIFLSRRIELKWNEVIFYWVPLQYYQLGFQFFQSIDGREQ